MQLKRNKGMEFETLRKSHRKQIIIGALAVCIIEGALTFNLTRAKYKLTQEIPLAKGTVNYKVPDMRIVAVKLSEDGENYTIANDVPTSGYTLNTEKSMCKVATESSGIENAPKDNNVTLEYIDGKINFNGISKRSTRCYLYFDKILGQTIDNIIAGLNAKSTTPDFSKTATTDEGVYSVSDGMYGGTSYYWRGAVTNNYVKFAGFCWRIVRINGDKTMRLIYDGSICRKNGESGQLGTDSISIENVAYNLNQNRSEYVGWVYSEREQHGTTVDSNIKVQIEKWYDNNIGNNTNYKSKIADGKFCNDRETQTSVIWQSVPTKNIFYAAYERNANLYTPKLICNDNDTFTLKIGLIAADEVALAGGKYYQITNKSYYLYNGKNYWTMTPSLVYYGDSESYISSRNFIIDSNGGLSYHEVINNTIGIRPVINLRSDVTFKAGGNGSQNTPYEVQ